MPFPVPSVPVTSILRSLARRRLRSSRTSHDTRVAADLPAAVHAPGRRDGVTLIEILIAMTILTVGIGGLLSNSANIATEMGGGVRQTVAATIAQSRIDSLSSLSCATLANAGVASGTSTKRGVTETWSVTDGRNIKTIAVTLKIIGRKNPLLYTTEIPCRD